MNPYCTNYIALPIPLCSAYSPMVYVCIYIYIYVSIPMWSAYIDYGLPILTIPLWCVCIYIYICICVCITVDFHDSQSRGNP